MKVVIATFEWDSACRVAVRAEYVIDLAPLRVEVEGSSDGAFAEMFEGTPPDAARRLAEHRATLLDARLSWHEEGEALRAEL